MSYEVGSYIDLRHLNKKTGVVPSASKKSNVQETASDLCEVGTQFIFNLTNKEAKAAKRIRIVYA